jgi:hypothetical protein
MAIGWLAAFKAFPWSDAVAAAPSVVQAARRVWSSVRRTEGEAAAAAESARIKDRLSSHADALSILEARVVRVESRAIEIANEAVASSEVLKSLAEQNSQLVRAVENLHDRTRLLLWLMGVWAVFTLVLVAWLALRG